MPVNHGLNNGYTGRENMRKRQPLWEPWMETPDKNRCSGVWMDYHRYMRKKETDPQKKAHHLREYRKARNLWWHE